MHCACPAAEGSTAATGEVLRRLLGKMQIWSRVCFQTQQVSSTTWISSLVALMLVGNVLKLRLPCSTTGEFMPRQRLHVHCAVVEEKEMPQKGGSDSSGNSGQSPISSCFLRLCCGRRIRRRCRRGDRTSTGCWCSWRTAPVAASTSPASRVRPGCGGHYYAFFVSTCRCSCACSRCCKHITRLLCCRDFG